MRLDGAVFVRPAPKVPSMPTRRAFVIAGCTFAAGIAVGGACGYSAGVAVGAGSGRDPASDEIPKSGDAELDELRRLAVKAPIDELMGHSSLFIELATRRYDRDEVLWKGVERVCDALLAGHQVTNSRVFPRVVAQAIEKSGSKFASRLLLKAERLRQLK